LTEQGFVFCCFNNSYKINPEIFASWMRILAAVDGSCLWLLAEFDMIEANLRREAHKFGVDPDRLVFGGNVPYAEYLARYRRADLFLDTLPFNAGTTANDALWAGLPVLTQPGSSFAGRMAASLLEALDLPELIAPTQDAYESTAIRLARDPAELGRIQARLALNRRQGPLFDTAGYTRYLEAAYREMMLRQESGRPPDDIELARPKCDQT
jgi:protein O-GlcNAc transferase